MKDLFKWRKFDKDIIILCVRWYLRYALSYRDITEMISERGICVDHSTIHRWVQKYAPILEEKTRIHLKKSGGSYRVDETYIKASVFTVKSILKNIFGLKLFNWKFNGCSDPYSLFFRAFETFVCTKTMTTGIRDLLSTRYALVNLSLLSSMFEDLFPSADDQLFSVAYYGL